jgi:hypothetical protein
MEFVKFIVDDISCDYVRYKNVCCDDQRPWYPGSQKKNLNIIDSHLAFNYFLKEINDLI